MKFFPWLEAAIALVFIPMAAAQSPAFAVATIRPSAEQVKFESDGATEILPATLHMRDVTIDTCIKWAYNVQESQVLGPDLLRSERYDILAKADQPVSEDQMKLMLRNLLAERFKLTFHRETKEMRAHALTVARSGHKLHASAAGTKPSRENTARSTIAKGLTIQEFAAFLARPLKTPIVDQTGLKGRYDFVLDFTPYLPPGGPRGLDDFLDAIPATLEGELGLKLERQSKIPIEVLVIDHVEKPSEN